MSEPPSPEPETADDQRQGLVIDHVAFGRELARRRAELGNPEASRNSGLRRTESKKALLKAIEDVGGTW